MGQSILITNGHYMKKDLVSSIENSGWVSLLFYFVLKWYTINKNRMNVRLTSTHYLNGVQMMGCKI